DGIIGRARVFLGGVVVVVAGDGVLCHVPFFLVLPLPLKSPLFPYTTLFRSGHIHHVVVFGERLLVGAVGDRLDGTSGRDRVGLGWVVVGVGGLLVGRGVVDFRDAAVLAEGGHDGLPFLVGRGDLLHPVILGE